MNDCAAMELNVPEGSIKKDQEDDSASGCHDDGFGQNVAKTTTGSADSSLKMLNMCGLGSWRPRWLQWAANHNVYSVAFILVGIVQGMSYTYFNGIVTTVEKAFQVDSQTMGIIVAGNDISQIMFGMAFTYVASRGNRPFWMATGIMIGALACFIYTSTQLFWDGSDRGGSAITSLTNDSSTWTFPNVELCSIDHQARIDIKDVVCDHPGGGGDSNMLAAIWLFSGQFISGIGGTTTYAIGVAYMDDNIKKRNSPLYIALTASMRSLGPTLGFMLASLCLKVYIDPADVPEYDSRDPRWLGAWWLGFLIVGILQALFAFPILLFPRHLPSTIVTKPITVTAFGCKMEHPTIRSPLKDFGLTLKRLSRNPILMLKTASFCFIILPVVGVSTFLPKYLEARFGQTASQANVLTGLAGSMTIMFGVLTGGIVIWKFKPKIVYITGWLCIIETLYAMGFLVIMNLDCNDITLAGVDFKDGRPLVNSECSKACDCSLNFDPVCVDRQNFLSPCLAGCSSAMMDVNDTKNVFYNCSCGISSSMDLIGHSGFCEDNQGVDCLNLWIYIGVIAFLKLVVSSARVGSLVITIRCVLKEDKGIAMTLVIVAGSIFGFIPGPIIYGAAIDSTCLLWEESPCGDGKGNCRFYNVQAFSYWFHGLLVVFGTITVFLNIIIAIISRRLRLYDEDD